MTLRARWRLIYFAAAIATMVFGLWVHRGGFALRPDARDIAGDATWAAMIVWFVSAVMPAGALRIRGATSLAICYATEFSQLLHTPSLDALRATMLGGLVLGSGFDPRDLASYTVGVAGAALLDLAVREAVRRGGERAQ